MHSDGALFCYASLMGSLTLTLEWPWLKTSFPLMRLLPEGHRCGHTRSPIHETRLMRKKYTLQSDSIQNNLVLSARINASCQRRFLQSAFKKKKKDKTKQKKQNKTKQKKTP